MTKQISFIMKTKRYTPKEIIESGKNPKLEDAYIKLPSQEIYNVARKRESYEVNINLEKINHALNKAKRDKYTAVHTHPVEERGLIKNLLGESNQNPKECLFPSVMDLLSFLKSPKEKASIIAARGTKTGKVYGYFIMRKTKQTPIDLSKESLRPLDAYKFENRLLTESSDIESRKEQLKRISDRYHLATRWIYADTNKRRGLLRYIPLGIGIFLIVFSLISLKKTYLGFSILDSFPVKYSLEILFIIGLLFLAILLIWYLKNKYFNKT